MTTQQQFVEKFRPRLLGFLAETWGTRKLAPSDFGQEVDRQFAAVTSMLNAMFVEAQPKDATKPVAALAPGTNQRKSS